MAVDVLSDDCKGRMLNCDRIHANIIGKTFMKGVLRELMTMPSLLTTGIFDNGNCAGSAWVKSTRGEIKG